MKNLIFILLSGMVGLAFAACSGEPLAERPYNSGINITPAPARIVEGEGNFTLDGRVVFVAAGKDAARIADFFAVRIARSTGFTLRTVEERPGLGYIDLTLDRDADTGEEGYLLEVTPGGIEIRAREAQGLFYAMQTVMQLLPAEIESATRVKGVAWTIPAVSIADEPRFAWRGMHLDVCRHFADVDFIKKQLDLLAMFKVNTFHWHLTEDQAWRIEIAKYPRLTEIGARRTDGEGNEYGPFFYTQEEVREVVAYAAERFIDVIPEIELPGHGVAAIAAYPELGCRGVQLEVRNIWGVANDVYCAGNEEVFTFLEDVLEEVIPLFPGEYFHIGGDECPKGRWEECPRCQARIRELGLVDDVHNSAEMKLQSWFVGRIGEFLAARGKKMIGWDEILEGGLPPSARVMSWRGEEGGIAAANMGHDVVMTPAGWMYFDGYQGDSKLLPVTIGGYRPLEHVYGYEPVPTRIDDDKRHHILGAQSNIWTEYKYDGDGMEHDIWPRMIATAELTWTPAERKNYADFERRLENQRARLDGHGVNYYIPRPEDAAGPSCNFVAFTERAVAEFKTTEPVRMVYTTDGSEPGLRSAEWAGPMVFEENTTLKIRSVTAARRMGDVRVIEYEKQGYAPATVVAEGTPAGIVARYYKGYRRTVAELEGLVPDETEVVAAPHLSAHRISDYREIEAEEFCSSALTGYIEIPADGVYVFSTDGELWIDGQVVISNEKDNHGTARRFSRSDRGLALARGPHEFRLARMGAVFGGWPTQWEDMTLSVRPEGETEFRRMEAEWFR